MWRCPPTRTQTSHCFSLLNPSSNRLFIPASSLLYYLTLYPTLEFSFEILLYSFSVLLAIYWLLLLVLLCASSATFDVPVHLPVTSTSLLTSCYLLQRTTPQVPKSGISVTYLCKYPASWFRFLHVCYIQHQPLMHITDFLQRKYDIFFLIWSTHTYLVPWDVTLICLQNKRILALKPVK